MKTLRQEIISYWNNSGLSSLESSTSHADDQLAVLDNYIENNILEEILEEFIAAKFNGNCIDVGAGYGRFTQTLKKYFKSVILLEAAPKIFTILSKRWGDDSNVTCLNDEFENTLINSKSCFILCSGILYLYSLSEVDNFFLRAHKLLEEEGYLLVRDFISLPTAQTVASRYVTQATCFYRTIADWELIAHQNGFSLVFFSYSKPNLFFLRKNKVLKTLDFLGLKKFITYPKFLSLVFKLSDLKTKKKGLRTCFLLFKKSI